MLGRRGRDPLTAASPALLPPFSAPSATGQQKEAPRLLLPFGRPDDPRLPRARHLCTCLAEVRCPARAERALRTAPAAGAMTSSDGREKGVGGGWNHPRGSGKNTKYLVIWAKGPNSVAQEPRTSLRSFRVLGFLIYKGR